MDVSSVERMSKYWYLQPLYEFSYRVLVQQKFILADLRYSEREQGWNNSHETSRWNTEGLSFEHAVHVINDFIFPCLKFIQIVILWVYYTVPSGFTLFWHFWAYIFNFLNYFLWLRITDEGSVPEMRILSILLIKSDLKWCIHLSRSLFFN